MPSMIDRMIGLHREAVLGMAGYSYLDSPALTDTPTQRVYGFAGGGISYDPAKGLTRSAKIYGDASDIPLVSGVYKPGDLLKLLLFSLGGTVLGGAMGIGLDGFSGLANALSQDYGMMLGHAAVAAPRIEKIKEGQHAGKFSFKGEAHSEMLVQVGGGFLGAQVGNA